MEKEKKSMVHGRVLLIAGGCIDFEFAKEYLENEKFDMVVGVDAGLDAVKRLGIKADAAIGDFDSAAQDTVLEYQKGLRDGFFPFPAKKDFTDLHLALRFVLERHPDEVVILGATGGRADHFMANVHILLDALLKGVSVKLADRYNRIYLMKDCLFLDRNEVFGKYISFLPFTDRVTGVTMQGFLYELDNAELKKGESIGVSNEFADFADQAAVWVKEGILIVIESNDVM